MADSDQHQSLKVEVSRALCSAFRTERLTFDFTGISIRLQTQEYLKIEGEFEGKTFRGNVLLGNGVMRCIIIKTHSFTKQDRMVTTYFTIDPDGIIVKTMRR
jgi:hypothetical protein